MEFLAKLLLVRYFNYETKNSRIKLIFVLSFQQAAYFIRDWRALHLVSYSPFLAALPMLCLMQESPRWLLATGQVERATEVIARVARANGRTSNVSKNMDIAVAEDDTGEKVKTYAQEHTIQYKI